jgi:glycogen operon protein
MAELAERLTGSADLYQEDGRRPFASVNFVTAHDGFTLHDLVSYNEKHNDANGEGGNDGESHNRSWNCGVEGDTDDLEVVALREQQKRNLLATLFLSQGVPMLLHGDELGRTQQGNNNVYCQDNELAWVDWERARDFEVLTGFVGRLAELRREHPVFRRRRFFDGRHDIGWYQPSGEGMTDDDWDTTYAKSLAVFLNGAAIREPDRRGEPVTDEPFWLLVNGAPEPVTFLLPDVGSAESWDVVLDTAAPLLDEVEQRSFKTGADVELPGRSVLLLRKAF